VTDDRQSAFVHHVELWTDDLSTAERQWGPVLLALGCEPYQRWADGRSWRRGGSYLVFEQSPELRPGGHDRLRAGINHLALRGDRTAALSAALAAGWSLRVDTGRAVHLTDSQGFELEVVYAELGPDDPGAPGAPEADLSGPDGGSPAADEARDRDLPGTGRLTSSDPGPDPGP
jgi:hypothetical protein